MTTKYNICAIIQKGRLEYEAVLFALSFRHHNPHFTGKLIFLEPRGDIWGENYDISLGVRAILEDNLAEIVQFETKYFGPRYPHGNKIEGLMALPKDIPFVFFDTDTIFTAPITDVPFDFSQPTASDKCENTWPKIDIYGSEANEIWKSLYDQFNLDFESSLDKTFAKYDWKRYLYFNAGWFFYKDPHAFGEKYLEYASQIEENTPKEVVSQSLDPWLDQVALPLVIHYFGGGRNRLPAGLLDGSVSCHYRFLGLFFACESDETVNFLLSLTKPHPIKKILKEYEPFKRMIYQNKGIKARGLFDRENLPSREVQIRKRLKNHNLWLR